MKRSPFAPTAPVLALLLCTAGWAWAQSADPPKDAEEAALRARKIANYQRAMAEREAQRAAQAQREAEEKAEAERAAAQAAAQRAAHERAQAARIAAAQERKRQEDAALAAEAERVLERAMADYPVLRTAAGRPFLDRILEKQRALVARGTYPAVAMVEAVADQAHLLGPARAAAAAPAASEAPRALAGCRWVTPTQWGCS